MTGATIAAVATGAAPGGVGIIRISGPDALSLGARLVRGVPEAPEPRRAYFCDFVDRAGQVLDQGLFLSFRAPASFTGEDVVELHAHGGPRLLRMLLAEVLADGRARLAQPGEFTRRAFLNGRLDLSRAEAVAALVSAESEAAVRAAAAQLAGGLSARLGALRAPLLSLLTDLEGVLNFPDEAEDADAGLAARLEPLVAAARALLLDAGRGVLLRRGARVALYGPVNAGKSTLFNRLAGADRALVDEEPGTTRDVLEARVEVDGHAWTLLDTAGLRASPERLERRGIDWAQAAVAGADLAVLLVPPGADAEELAGWRAWAHPAGSGGAARALEVLARADERAPPAGDDGTLRVSGLTGAGVDALAAAITTALFEHAGAGAVALVSDQQLDALRRAYLALEDAAAAAVTATVEAVAGELTLALEALGELTGERASEAVLDALFARFCIGK